MKTLWMAVGAAVLGMSATASANSLLIDNFDYTVTPSFPGAPGTDLVTFNLPPRGGVIPNKDIAYFDIASVAPPGEAPIGGFRGMNILAGSGQTNIAVTGRDFGGNEMMFPGTVAFSAGATPPLPVSPPFFEALLIYDAGGAGLDADLSAFSGGVIQFVTEAVDMVGAGITLTLTLTDGTGSSSEFTQVGGFAPETLFKFPIADFVPTNGPVDLSDIESIALNFFSEVPAADFQFDIGTIEAAIPAPVSLAGLAFGLIVAGVVARRRG